MPHAFFLRSKNFGSKNFGSKNFCSPAGKSLRRAAGLGVGLLSLLSLSAGHAAFAGTVQWNGPDGADWFANPSYWSSGSTPGAGDDAVNMSTAAMTLGQSTTINSFFSNGAFTLQGGDFSGGQANSASTIQVNSVFTDNGGGISNFTINQGTGGSVAFGNSGNNYLDNTVFNAGVTFAGDAYTRLYDTNTFNGAITLNSTSNGIQLQDSNTNMVIGSAGRLNGYGNIFDVYDGTVTNNGTVNANTAAQTLALNTDHFNNAGTAEATATGSLLTLNSSGTNTGTFAASGGGMIGIHSGITSGANSQYNAAGGTILVDGGNLTGTIGSTTGTGLTFSNNGNNYLSSATVNGTLTLSAADAYLRLYNTVTENGAINIGTTSNGIQLQDSNTNLVIGSAGSLNGYGNLFEVYDGTITNNGTINANSSGNALTQNVDYLNNGSGAMLEATGGGILDLNTNTTNSGTIAAKSGGVVNISDSFISSAGSLMDGAGGTFNVNAANLVGTLTGTAGTTLSFSNSGSNSINNGTPATVLNTDLTFNNDAYTRIYGTTTSNDTIHFNSTSNGIQLQDSNTNLINNGSLLGYGNLFQVYDGTITNNGTINANSSGNALTLNVDHLANSSGATLEATGGGILDLNMNTVNSGTIAAKSGGVVNISDSLVSNAGSLMDGAGGTFSLQNVGVTGIVTGTAGTVLNFGNSGSNYISGATLSADLGLTADAYTRIYGTTTSNNTINLSTTTNGIQLQDSNTNLINNGSLNGYGTIYQVYDGTFTNNGTTNANSSGNALTFNIDNTDNSAGAVLEATNGGVLNLANNTTNSGTITAGTGGVVNISGKFVSSANSLMDGVGGTFSLQNVGVTGIVTGTAGTTLNFGNSGSNYIDGATLNTNLTLNNDAYTRIYDTVTENGAINLNSTSNGIQLQDSNTNLINNGSLLGYGNLFQVYDGTITNNGTINANSSGNALTLNVDHLANSSGATLEATGGGILDLNMNTVNSGTIAAKSGGVVNISDSLVSNAGSLMDGAGGTFSLQNVGVTGIVTGTAGTVLNFGNSGSNYINGAVLNADIALNADAYTRLYGTVTDNSAISLSTTSNGIQLQDSNTNLVIGSAGSLNGYGTIYQVYDGTLTNNGTVNANSSGNALNINTDNFVNTGTAEVQNGAALSVTSAATNSGNVLVNTGGTATFTQSVSQTAGLTQVNGTLNASPTLTGGTLSGSGTVNGNVANNGGTVAAGSPFGTLAVNGAFSQALGGTLDAVFSSTQSNLLMVSGAVTTGGTLSVLYSGTGPFTAGSAPFTFLDYGSLGTEPMDGSGFTQYFSNETPISNNLGTIVGSNGFTYDLINNTALDALQLSVVINGAPTPPPPAVPEASTNISLGALLALGGLGLWRVKRRTASSAS